MRARRGIMFIEMLVAMILLSAFAIASTRLFYAIFKVTHDAAEGQNANASFDTATAALRSDVWGAKEIAVPDASTAKINDSITWTINGQTITRRESGVTRSWSAPANLEFAADAAGLKINVAEGQGLVLINQPRLIAKLTP